MTLAQYTDTFWFPSGILATSMAATVFTRGNSAPAILWANSAGTIPLPNPLSTDSFGVLTFFAAVGEYWINIDTETFLVDVGMSQEQADLSSGTASGGEINVNGLNAKAIDIAPLVGYVVANDLVGAQSPGIVKIDFPGATVVMDAAAQTRPQTWWLMDGTGAVIQQAAQPTNSQRRTHLILGVTFYDTAAGVIIEDQTLPVILPQQANQLVDLMDALRPFSISGNDVAPNGANLGFNKSSGTIFARAFNHFSGAVPTNDPHVSGTPAHLPAQFRRVIRNDLVPTPTVVTTLDPANYDLNGVLTPVGGGVNTSTIQRVYLFAANSPTAQLVVQYGQMTYSSLANAVAAVGSGTFVPAPFTASGTLIGYISVIRSATNLSDPTQAVFTKTDKFATP